jgi:hypothetical protein
MKSTIDWSGCATHTRGSASHVGPDDQLVEIAKDADITLPLPFRPTPVEDADESDGEFEHVSTPVEDE